MTRGVANYSVWVRGYGLVDSPKVRAKPGQTLNLTAIPPPNDRAAAEYYPATYWYSMLKIPDAGQFGGKSKIRFDPTTGLSEVYNVPASAFGLRGGDIDKNGVVWASMSSGHLGSF